MRPAIIKPLSLVRTPISHNTRRAIIRSWPKAQRRTYETSDDDSARIQNIRLRRPPFFNSRRLTRTLIYTVTFYVAVRLFVAPHITVEIVEAPVDDAEKKRLENGGPGSGIEVTDEDEEEEMEEGDIFIPFTRAAELPRRYYKGSDPEWQEFIKVAQDNDRQTKLCEQVKTLLLKKLPHNMSVQKLLGTNLECGKHWIDFAFPDGPPPDHSRDGLIVGNGRIAWGSEVVDDNTYRQQSRLIWPKEAVESVLFSARIMLQLGYQRAMNLLGYKVDAKSQYARDLTQIQHVAKIHSLSLHKRSSGQASTDGSLVKSEQQSSPARPWPLSVIPRPGAGGGTASASEQKPVNELAVFTWSAFTLGYLKSRRSQRREPPRGTFMMHGLVELRGSRGRMLFDVRAICDPRQDTIVDLAANLRNYKPWSQRPRGGN